MTQQQHRQQTWPFKAAPNFPPVWARLGRSCCRCGAREGCAVHSALCLWLGTAPRQPLAGDSPSRVPREIGAQQEGSCWLAGLSCALRPLAHHDAVFCPRCQGFAPSHRKQCSTVWKVAPSQHLCLLRCHFHLGTCPACN